MATELSGYAGPSDSMPAMSIAIDQLQSNVETLGDLVDRLLHKIGAVTAPDSDLTIASKPENGIDPARACSPLTSEINSIGRHVGDISSRIRNTIGRIEL